MRSVSLLVALTVVTAPSGQVRGSSQQEPPGVELAASPGSLVGPPDWFDPGTVAYLGTSYGLTDTSGELWIGRLGDADLRPVGIPAHHSGWLAGDGNIVVTVSSGSQRRGLQLVLLAPDGTSTTLLDDVVGDIVVGAGGDVVYALRAASRGAQAVSGAWRVPLDGSEVARVLPPGACGDRLAVSHDERSFAYGCVGRDSPGRITARFDLGPVVRPLRGAPLGFDAAGRLVLGKSRYDPTTGRLERLKGIGQDASESMPPGGRTLLSISLDGGRLMALDLVDGSTRDWDLVPGDWGVTGLSSDRYAVLARFSDDVTSLRVDTYAVVDLWEGWLGYVPFLQPAAD